MRLRNKKKTKEETAEVFAMPLSQIGGRDVKLEGSSLKAEKQIWERMRKLSGLNNEQIDALPENEFDKLYEKAVEQ